MKNFNWGHGIALFYSIFVGVLFTALIASRSVDHSLVADDYYALDIAYQQQYEKIQNNLSGDQIEISHQAAQKTIKIDFQSADKIEGEIHFYRPSNQSLDFTLPIKDLSTTIDTRELAAGKWRIKVDWRDAQKAYYQTKEIYL